MQALILLFSAWSSVQGGPGPQERLTSMSLGKAPSAAAVTMRVAITPHPTGPQESWSPVITHISLVQPPPTHSKQMGTADLAVRPPDCLHLPGPVWGGGYSLSKSTWIPDLMDSLGLC